MERRRPALLVAVLAAVVAVAGFAGPGPAAAKSPNLLPNADFEESAVEPGPLAGQSPQPLLPTGWVFEGSAGLFDHSPHGGSGGSKRAAAISVPAGGKTMVCADYPVGCHQNPVNKEKNETVVRAVSINPAWRNAQAVPVQEGRSYELSVDLAWELATENEGAFGLVRWYPETSATNAGQRATVGAPTVTQAFVVKATKSTSTFRKWGRVSGVVKAPKGATTAVVLLGATDDVFIGKFQFDKVYFGAI